MLHSLIARPADGNANAFSFSLIRESVIFVDGSITTNEQFDSFITDLFGDIATKSGLSQEVNRVWPPVPGIYPNQTARVRDFIRDAAFACNARYVSQSYASKTWSGVFAYGSGWHGLDLIPLFLRANVKLFGQSVPVVPDLGAFSKTYQSYLVSHAVTGDPNTQAIGGLWNRVFGYAATPWPKTPKFNGENVDNVLVMGDNGFSVGSDDQVPKKNCDFLQDFMIKVAEDFKLDPGVPGTPYRKATT